MGTEMTTEAIQGTSVVLAVVPLLLAILAYAILLRATRQLRGVRTEFGVFAARVAIGCGLWWFAALFLLSGPLAMLFRLLGLAGEAVPGAMSSVRFTSSWPLGMWCLLGALATEIVLWCYRFERRSLSRASGNALVGLRIALLVLLIFLLAQPVWHTEWESAVERYVAVLIDDSASMQLADTEATPSEKLATARLFGVEFAEQPLDLSELQQRFQRLANVLQREAEAFETIGTADADAAHCLLKARRAPLMQTLAKLDDTRKSLTEALGKLRKQRLSKDAALTVTMTSINKQVKALPRSLQKGIAKQLTAETPAQAKTRLKPLRQQLQNAAAASQRLSVELTALTALLDDALYASLSPRRRAEIDRQSEATRRAIAQHVLSTQRDGMAMPLLAYLEEEYSLKVYRFASSSQVATGSEIRDDVPSTWRGATNLASALTQAKAEIPAGRLSGVLVLTDGRHNADQSVVPIASELRVAGVPVHTVMFGSRHVPADAAIAKVAVSQSVLLGDKVSLTTTLKIDGYRGREVAVKLFYENEEYDRRLVTVPEDRYRVDVDFSHQPKSAGLHDYRFELVAADDSEPLEDHLAENNTVTKTVPVADDRTKLLLVESRPRWEFRYLKNLFTGRDRTVHLQYVLTRPDRIAGVPRPAVVHASASRAYGEFAATALPASREEWMKFDVIVLGDVGPETLTPETLEILDDFVAKRGGSVITIAGPNFMPHAFADTPLANLLPVAFDPSTRPLHHGPEPSYRLALTSDGAAHSIMDQSSGQTSNDLVWLGMPQLRWRHPAVEAKAGATVLAYAQPMRWAGEDDSENAFDTLAKQRKREQQNPLICVHDYGAGRVLMLTFDRMWRLRLKVGNKYHYRFWGQALRWATAEKLPFGSTYVRLGTDRQQYRSDQSVLVRARLVDQEANPVLSDNVAVKVFHGENASSIHPMNRVADQPGRYEIDLGTFAEPGSLRVELVGAAVESLLAEESRSEGVGADVAILPVSSAEELVEYAADEIIPRQLANMTKGLVVAPLEATSLLGHLGEPTRMVREEASITLWDAWPLLLLCLAAACGEWGFRKKMGLT